MRKVLPAAHVQWPHWQMTSIDQRPNEFVNASTHIHLAIFVCFCLLETKSISVRPLAAKRDTCPLHRKTKSFGKLSRPWSLLHSFLSCSSSSTTRWLFLFHFAIANDPSWSYIVQLFCVCHFERTHSFGERTVKTTARRLSGQMGKNENKNGKENKRNDVQHILTLNCR